MKVLFLGTPEFAVESLKAIHRSTHEVVAVVTAPDKPAGRGRQMHASPVRLYALENGLKLFQPEKLRDEEFLAQLRVLKPDVAVVVAFRMMPEVLWRLPRMGTFNLHGSLLPQYRGAAPIQWAIINGEKESGVTTFFINEKIDEGAILMSAKEAIDINDTAGMLFERLMIKGANLVVQTLHGLEAGTLEPKSQTYAGALKEAPKLHQENTRIDWCRSAEEIRNLIRGLNPFPAAWTEISYGDKKERVKILSALISGSGELKSGELRLEKSSVFIGTGSTDLQIVEWQWPGKRKMSAEEFLRGFNFRGEMQAR
jgi:methionyl-tRNA formyltransferase